MKAIKTTGTVKEQGQLALDSPLNIEKASCVEIIVLISKQGFRRLRNKARVLK